MAIKMKYSEITNGQLIQTLHKIGNAQINPNETYKIRKIAKWLRAVMKNSTEVSTRFQNDILPKFAEKREDGTFIDRAEQKGAPFKIIKEKMAEYKKALDLFNENEVTLPADLEKLNWKDISHSGIKPIEILNLEHIFDEASLDEVPMDDEEGPGVPTNVVHGPTVMSVGLERGRTHGRGAPSS